MLDIDRTEEILDGEFVNADEPASAEIMPVTQSVQWLPKQATPRPDPSFLAQVIAAADEIPQTRSLRRASLADALLNGASPRPLHVSLSSGDQLVGYDQAARDFKSGDIILTGATKRESVWAFERKAPTKGGWITTQNGPEEVTAAEFARRIKE